MQDLLKRFINKIYPQPTMFQLILLDRIHKGKNMANLAPALSYPSIYGKPNLEITNPTFKSLQDKIPEQNMCCFLALFILLSIFHHKERKKERKTVGELHQTNNAGGMGWWYKLMNVPLSSNFILKQGNL